MGWGEGGGRLAWLVSDGEFREGFGKDKERSEKLWEQFMELSINEVPEEEETQEEIKEAAKGSRIAINGMLHHLADSLALHLCQLELLAKASRSVPSTLLYLSAASPLKVQLKFKSISSGNAV